MDAIDCLKTRHSVRAYEPTPVPRPIIEDIVDCGRLAATANNVQPWIFVAVEDSETRGRLAAMTDYGKFIAEAPVCVAVFCRDVQVLPGRRQRRDTEHPQRGDRARPGFVLGGGRQEGLRARDCRPARRPAGTEARVPDRHWPRGRAWTPGQEAAGRRAALGPLLTVGCRGPEVGAHCRPHSAA